MDVKMICVNVCSDKYAYIIIAERAWESGEGGFRLAALLFGLPPLIVFLPLLSVFYCTAGRDHNTSIIYDLLVLKVKCALNCYLIKVQASLLESTGWLQN